MPLIIEEYDQLKIDKIRHFLEEMTAKQQVRPYEIFVDALKVVPKTAEPKDFDNYEYYVNEHTKKIRILIYYSMTSPRNDQFCFMMKPENPGQTLSGPGSMEGIIEEKLQARDREHELRRLQEDLAGTKQKLEDAEDYIEQLEDQLELANDNKHKLKNLDLVEFGAAMIERTMLKNPVLLDRIGLSGLALPEAGAANGTNGQTQASFEKKGTGEQTEQTVTPPELAQYLPLLEQLDKAFEKEQLTLVMAIIQQFINEPVQLQTVAELLNIETTIK